MYLTDDVCNSTFNLFTVEASQIESNYSTCVQLFFSFSKFLSVIAKLHVHVHVYNMIKAWLPADKIFVIPYIKGLTHCPPIAIVYITLNACTYWTRENYSFD